VPVVNLPPMLKTIIGDLDKRVRKLEQSPPKRPYLSVYDSTTQTAPNSASVYAVTYNNTVDTNFVSIVSNSRITVQRTGVYNIQFSMQLQNSAASDYNVQIWLRKNGSDIADSNTEVTVPGKHAGINGAVVAAWNFLLPLSANDYVQLYWWAENSAVNMPYVAGLSSPTRPAIPSVILTVVEQAW
jgi:hypothetical protein